jgi:hypothetical protein
MGNLMLCRSLDAALEDDDAAIRVLNNNIDGNGTGRISSLLTNSPLASMIANLIQDGWAYLMHADYV